MSKKVMFEKFTREICSNCKVKEECQEKLRIRIDNSIKCDRYEPIYLRKHKINKHKNITTAKKRKPLMKGLV